jgi:transcriptional regulator with XRE-family HTH domain
VVILYHTLKTTKGVYMLFGEFIKEKRLSVDLSLRKFCDMAGVDASNWSKIERNLMPLSVEHDKLVEICHILNLQEGTPEWTKFFDLAAVAKGKIPEYVYSDQNVLEALPIFFRTASKEKPTDEELNKLIELIKHR